MALTEKRSVYCIALILLVIGAYAQKKRSLVVAEYRIDSTGTGNYTYLTKYNFDNGKLLSKDTLFGIDVYDRERQTHVNCARFDLGTNRIHQGRYVISGMGDVVDLQSRSLVNDGDKQLIEVIGDSLLYNEGWGIDEEEGFSFFNLKTRKFTPIRDGSFHTKGGFYSPDYRHSLQYAIYKKGQFQLSSDKIVLSAIDKRSEVIVPFCHPTRRTSDLTMGFPQIPLTWVDNESFLYADYPYTYSGRGIKSTEMVVIKRLNIVSLKTDTIGLIDSVMADRSDGLFKRDKANNLIFFCQKGEYKIDVSNKTIMPEQFIEFGNGFKEDYNEGKGDVILYFEDRELARAKNYTRSVSTGGYLATVVDPADFPKQKSYLGVWSAASREWISIEISWICDLIGWIEEPD